MNGLISVLLAAGTLAVVAITSPANAGGSAWCAGQDLPRRLIDTFGTLGLRPYEIEGPRATRIATALEAPSDTETLVLVQSPDHTYGFLFAFGPSYCLIDEQGPIDWAVVTRAVRYAN